MGSNQSLNNIGNTIRNLRLEQNLRIIDIARETGLSTSLISQVERAVISPSLDTLIKIASALAVPVGALFDDQPVENSFVAEAAVEKKSPVVHVHERKMLSPREGVFFYLLNPDMSGPIEFIYNIYEPGTTTGTQQYTHPGSECGLIVRGELLVTIENDSYLLKEGDSITFESTRPHSKANVGTEQCHCIWANTPPWF